MKAFIIIISQLIMNLGNAQPQESQIPADSNECGQLKEHQFYNPEHITAEDEFPWMGLLKLSSSQEAVASVYTGLAVLISRRYLLANAHLFHAVDDYDNISVVVGAWDKTISWFTRSQQQEYKIDLVTMHPNFSRDLASSHIFYNDIAVIRLREDVAFNARIQPICLPTAADMALSSNNVAHYMPYAGFPDRLSDGTKKIKIFGRVMGAISCGRHKRINITAGQMCAFSSDKLVPLGRGSALMGVAVENGEPHHYYLIGLLSVSGVNMPYFDADILVRIDTYMEWIEFNMY